MMYFWRLTLVSVTKTLWDFWIGFIAKKKVCGKYKFNILLLSKTIFTGELLLLVLK